MRCVRSAASRFARQTATAVVLATTAAWSHALGAALEPEMLPDPLWWRGALQIPIARDPLMSSVPAGVRLASEWAPLYNASDGGRIEQSRSSLRVATLPGRWRAGFELESRSGIARTAEADTRVGAAEPQATLRSIAVARYARRIQIGAAASQNNERAGWSFATRAEAAPWLRLSFGWSRLPERGRAEVQAEGVVVSSEGNWDDQRVAWRLDARARPNLALWLGQQALDRRAAPAAPGPADRDRLVPTLAWRASEVGIDALLLDTRWIAIIRYGEGRQRTSITRGGTQYAAITGPLFNSLASFEARPARLPLAARAWAGRWSSDARASLALWPFDGAAALLGTRRVARSSASLDHSGVGLDYVPARHALEGGLALSRLVPRAEYQTWQATLFGLGHEDYTSGETGLREAWLLGTRLATSAAWRGVRARIEAVQWIPVQMKNERATGAGVPSGGAEAPRAGPSARGGTVLRISLETSGWDSR